MDLKKKMKTGLRFGDVNNINSLMNYIYIFEFFFPFKAPTFKQMDQLWRLSIFILSITTLLTGMSISDAIYYVEFYV